MNFLFISKAHNLTITQIKFNVLFFLLLISEGLLVLFWLSAMMMVDINEDSYLIQNNLS